MKIIIGVIIVAFAASIGGYLYMQRTQKDPFELVNSKLLELQENPALEKATLAGGCFWCMEGPFESMEGVVESISGFSGGNIEDPAYDQVVMGGTGHRESVQIYYDPQIVSYKDILTKYWQQIDPTDDGGQFADRGEHYTTAIFYHSDEQKKIAEEQIQDLNQKGIYDSPIVTKVLPYTSFYPAEEYHQDFYKKSAEYYQRYKKGSGRADYIEAAKQYWQDTQ